MAELDYIPDIGIDYGHLTFIELNWVKPTHKHRCAWVIGPHETWDKQLRIWPCQHKGTHTVAGVHLCSIHALRAQSLHPDTELPFRLFLYYVSLIQP